uniref:DUF7597 domain-containing protein n=1 Tax=Oryza nivara TaxID=4536 RepID=A0A0E0HZU4_ORYNI
MVPPSPPSGWDFHNEIKNQCRLLHGTPVHSSSFYCSRPFKLVVDVSRSTFRLEESSVALALRACLGGSPAGFLVKHLNDRCYTFCVCNKSVGLWIYNLRSYICHDYHMRFFLWRDGGPNWGFEFRRWESEQLNEWTVVKKKKSKSSVVASSSVPISRVFNRLHVLDPPCPSPVAAGEKVSVSAPDPISHKPVSRPKVPVADGNAPNAISKSNGLPIGFGKSRPYHRGRVDTIRSPVHRDALVLGQPIAYDEVRFVRHDQGPNWRNAPYNHRDWIMLLDFPLDYVTFHNFADVFPLDDDLPLGEGPVDPNFGNVQNVNQDQNQGWGNWDEGQDNENVDFLPNVPQPVDVLQINSSSTSNSTNSVISISSDEAIEHVSDNSLMVQKVFVDANLLRLLCQRFPQVMFDENFVKDASFWSTLTSDHHSFQGNASGSSDWASRIVPDSVSVGSDEVLDPTPLAVVPPSDSFLALTAFEDPVMPTKRAYKKRAAGSVTPIVTTGLRRSSRLLAISDGHKIGFKDDDLVEPDPNQRIGNPRGKSVKKLKQVAHEAGLLFSGSSLQESDFMEDSAEVEGPASCLIPLLQKMATNLCGVAPQDVTQESLLASSPKYVPV